MSLHNLHHFSSIVIYKIIRFRNMWRRVKIKAFTPNKNANKFAGKIILMKIGLLYQNKLKFVKVLNKSYVKVATNTRIEQQGCVYNKHPSV